MIWVILHESWFSSGRDVVAQQWLPDKWDIPSVEWRIRNRSPDASRVEKQYLFHFRDRLRILHQTRLKTMKVLMKGYSLKVFLIQKMVREDEQQKVEATLKGMVRHFEKSKWRFKESLWFLIKLTFWFRNEEFLDLAGEWWFCEFCEFWDDFKISIISSSSFVTWSSLSSWLSSW